MEQIRWKRKNKSTKWTFVKRTIYGNFKLNFQGKEFDLKKHFYYDNIELVYYFGYSEAEIKEFFANVNEENIRSIDSPTYNAKGWIATAAYPANLKTEDGTKIKGVVIYINGKIADEDIFKNYPNDMYANAYVIGEVNADFLDALPFDPVLSNREGLNHEIDEVIELREYLQKIRSAVLNAWGVFRASRPVEQQEYLHKALNESGLKNIYEKLPEPNRAQINKYAQRLFDKPRETEDAEEKAQALAEIILPAVFQIVNEEALKELLEKTGLSSDEILQAFADIFNFSEINHAIRMRSNVMEKLQIISKLKELRENGEVEKIFEKHLAKNPWLIEPYWIAQQKNIRTQDYYTLCKIDNSSIEKKYIDIIIELAGYEIPIIVEIKREKATAYSAPDRNEILNQITGYRQAISAYIKKSNLAFAGLRERDIKAYFICGDIALSKLSPDDRDALATFNIEVKSYDVLIKQSELIFSTNFGLDEE